MTGSFMRRVVFSTLAVVAVLTSVEGCLGRSPDVRHFVLGTSTLASSVARAPNVGVLVGPVRLPAYLERSQIAALESGGEVSLDEFARWLGGFEENFLRAIAFGLTRELGSEKIVVDPMRAPFEIDYQVRLHVDDLIIDEGDVLRMRVRWALVSASDERSTGLFLMDEIIPVDGASIEDVVRAHEEALAELASRIANELVARETDI